MLSKLKASQGKNVIIELFNGRVISGKIVNVTTELVSMESDEGVGTFSINAVQVVWDDFKQSLSKEDIERFEEKVKPLIACTSYPGFTCDRQYTCRPEDICTFSFSCPTSYTPGFPSGGGACPTFNCGYYQYSQPCSYAFNCGNYQFSQPCSHAFNCGYYQFSQPCSYAFNCGYYQFSQPCSYAFNCGYHQYSQPCSYAFNCGYHQYSQPCSYAFNCGYFQFTQPCGPFQIGSQCNVPGGFTCSGQQFIGATGPTTGPGPLHKHDVSPQPNVNKDDQSKNNKK